MDEEGVRRTEPLSSSEKEELIPRNRKAVSKSGWTSWLVYTAAVVNIKKHFRKDGSFSDIMWSSAVAIFAVGGMFGVTVGQVTANSLGSKRALFLNNIPAIIGSVMMFSSYFAEGPALLIIGRFVFGFNNGVNTAVAPVYLSEIAPIRLRGALGVLNQFGIVLGLLSGYILGLKQIEQEQHLREEKINVFTLLQMSELRAPLFISLVLQVAQQFSGINAVFYYSTSIFRSAGVQEDRVASCFIGIVSVVMTGITVKVVEIMGRRSLMLWGLGGMFIFYAVMTISFRFEVRQQ
ncbi:Glucose transporter type 1 [Acropora cervicornis]|uniref:Glucose transporter type 1 n=1 Tax=Acropora cervicornis TaxID=6130 RepID=A0AAD9UWN8_ACRCE|nr:Glucose transporter type 1 [Acropora cervicornis]